MLLSDRPSTPELNGDDHHQGDNKDYDDNVNENSNTTDGARRLSRRLTAFTMQDSLC